MFLHLGKYNSRIVGDSCKCQRQRFAFMVCCLEKRSGQFFSLRSKYYYSIDLCEGYIVLNRHFKICYDSAVLPAVVNADEKKRHRLSKADYRGADFRCGNVDPLQKFVMHNVSYDRPSMNLNFAV